MESFVSSLPWRESVLKWVTSDFWFCLFLCPASHARSQSQGWYNTVRVMYCIVPIQYCNVMYCISNFCDKVVF